MMTSPFHHSFWFSRSQNGTTRAVCSTGDFLLSRFRRCELMAILVSGYRHLSSCSCEITPGLTAGVRRVVANPPPPDGGGSPQTASAFGLPRNQRANRKYPRRGNHPLPVRGRCPGTPPLPNPSGRGQAEALGP